jgi:histidine decarboxylase
VAPAGTQLHQVLHGAGRTPDPAHQLSILREACVSTEPGQLDATSQRELDELLQRCEAARATSVGFPAAVDIDYTPLAPFLRYLLNNLADPMVDGDYPHHTKVFEREVLGTIADLLRAPATDWWGYVTGGATEGTEHALHLARTRHPTAVVYHSRQAHHATVHAITRLGMTSVVIRTGEHGEIDYQDLHGQVARRRHRPAVVVANAGTALTEAVDNTATIDATLTDLAVDRRWVHVDAALSGLPLATMNPADRPPFDFADGATSIIVSGHKFLGTPLPCGVLVLRDSHRAWPFPAPTYTGSPPTTLTNSRSGLAVLCLWYALRLLGVHGLTTRAEQARQLAAYTHRRLRDIGWNAHHHRHAFTVTLDTPPPAVTTRWALPATGNTSHVICMPGITRENIDAFIDDLHSSPDHPATPATTPPGPPRVRRGRRPWRGRPTDTERATTP